MDDEFMYRLRATAPEEFADSLRQRLEHRESAASTFSSTTRLTSRFVMVGAVVAAALVLFAFPAVRASAQAFLNLFRVVNFTAVPVNVDRFKQLGPNGLDIRTLIGQQIEVLADPGPPQTVLTLGDAAQAAGIPVKLPSVVPPGLVIVRTEVEGEHAARVTADTAKLTDVLNALGITDVRPPAALDGQVATVRVPPIVRTVYANGNQEVAFIQARSPEVTLPASVDLAALGEIGLRIVGFDAVQAHTLAQAIDWRGTLIVPVPAGASSFRQVDIHGNRGLFVESTERGDLKAVLWSENGLVYGMTGGLSDALMLQMAESVQ
jgi:hypothetical protein